MCAQNVKYKDLHRIVLTCIIYNNEGKFLITKRAPTKKAYPNKWTVPGGGVEVSDYIDKPKTTSDAWYYAVEETLKREVKEEVNLDIEKPEYLLDLIFIRPDNVPVLVLSYYAKYKSGDVVLEEGDSTEHAWISADEVDDYDLIEGIGDEIKEVDEILQEQK